MSVISSSGSSYSRAAPVGPTGGPLQSPLGPQVLVLPGPPGSDDAVLVQGVVTGLANAQGGAVLLHGAFNFASQLVLYPNVALTGIAPISYFNVSAPYGAAIKSTFNGDAILITGDARVSTFTALSNLEIAGTLGLTNQNGLAFDTIGGNTKDIFLDCVVVDHCGNVGVRLGTSGGGAANTKLHCRRMLVEFCGSHGIDGTNSTGGFIFEMDDCYIANNVGIGYIPPANSLDFACLGGGLINNSGGAISVPNSISSGRILGMFFSGNGGAGIAEILVPSDTFGAGKLIIKGNTFNAIKANHIVLATTNFAQALIEGNTFIQNTGDAITFVSRAGNKLIIRDNMGYNDVKGKIASPFSSVGRVGAGTGTVSAAPTASTTYTVEGNQLYIASSAGTGVSITIADVAANTVQSGLATFAGMLPVGYTINFGAFTVAPTVYVGVT